LTKTDSYTGSNLAYPLECWHSMQTRWRKQLPTPDWPTHTQAEANHSLCCPSLVARTHLVTACSNSNVT